MAFPPDEQLVTLTTTDGRDYAGYRLGDRWHLCVDNGGDVPTFDDFVVSWQSREG